MFSRIEVAFQPLESGLQVGSILVSKVAIFLKRLADYSAQLGRQRRIDLRDRNRSSIQDRIEHHRRCIAQERQNACRHLVEDRADGKEIRPRVGYLTTRLFR